MPSSSRLRQLSAGSDVSTSKVYLKYLKHQSENLSALEKIVVLLFDEVFMAKWVEYSDGSFVGLTEDGVPAKTVLAFMVPSICGKYRDFVCLIPVNKLNTDTSSQWFNRVLKSICALSKHVNTSWSQSRSRLSVHRYLQKPILRSVSAAHHNPFGGSSILWHGSKIMSASGTKRSKIRKKTLGYFVLETIRPRDAP